MIRSSPERCGRATRPLGALPGLFVLFLVAWIPSHAQEMAVPVDIQVPILMKIISFDRNLSARAGDEIVVGVLYQHGLRASTLAKEQFLDEAAQLPVIGGLRIRVVEIRIDGEQDLRSVIRGSGARVLYVTPVRSISMGVITGISRELGITTMTGVPEFVNSGIAVGVGLKGERPSIVINLSAAREEGADFSSQLLRLARIIQ